MIYNINYSSIESNKLNIFTFWEPKNKIPYYLKLCQNTWSKIKNVNIILLDYENLKQYIDISIFHNNFYKLSLPMQADCIRVALLEKYGGLWLDLDTIIMSDISKLLNDKITFVIDDNYLPHLALIYVPKPHDQIMKLWLEEIKSLLINFDEEAFDWDYVGNAIINKYVNFENKDKFNLLNRHEYNIFPELIEDFNDENIYYDYWFNSSTNINSIQSKYLIMLHNSWMPEYYLGLNELEFKNDNSLLTKLLLSLQENEVKNLMIVAHPDDEVLWGGQLLLDKNNWLVICVTNGDDKIRKFNFEKVMKKINAKYEIWDYIDSIDYINPLNWNENIKDNIRKDIQRVINENNFDFIITHNQDGETGHIHHITLNNIVTEIVEDKNKLFYFNVNNSTNYKMSNEKNELLNMYTIGRHAILKWWNLSKRESHINYYDI